MNQLYDATLVRRAGEREIVRLGGRKNKNEILGLTNARLVKEKHLKGIKYSRK
jgi:poly(A) polymerase Pap1